VLPAHDIEYARGVPKKSRRASESANGIESGNPLEELNDMLKRTRLSLAIGAAFGAGLVGVAPAVFAQGTVLERAEITGSSLRRVDAETALPVTIIRGEDLVKQGVTTAEQAVQRIAANQSNFGVSQAIGATTGGKAEADLRGLGAATGQFGNKTLVLLNGRRIANHAFDSAAVDLNSIPFSAIDRIEVLRDGASAIYGTDAIGGVINFILRRDYQGVEVMAEWQAPQADGGGETARANILAGWGSLSKDGWNVMGALDWRKQNVLEAKDRDFAKTGVLGPTRDDLLAGTSGTSFPGDAGGFEPSGPACAPPGSLPATNAAGTAFSSCRYDFTRDIDIIPENEQLTWLLRGSFALGKDHLLSAEYLNATNEATSKVAAAPTSHFIPATSPFFPAGASVIAVPGFGSGNIANWRQNPAGKRVSGDDTTTERYYVELTGLLFDWDYRTSLGRTTNESTASVKSGYVSDDIMQQGVIDGAINPFGPQSAAGTAAIASAQNAADTLIGEYKMSWIDARVSKDIYQMASGPLSLALGTEFRKEESFFEATAITAQLGSLGIDPDSDTSGDRDVFAFFGELNIPLMKNLEMSLAVRYDDYSDFGNTTNPKIGLRYQPTKSILLRASYNTGFRAPTLYEIYQPQSLTFTTDNYDDPLLCPGGVPVPGATEGAVCGQQVLSRSGGPGGLGLPIDSLQPEESDTWSVGFVFEPMQSVTFGLDYWSINLENQISGLPEQAIFGDPTKYAGRFVRCSQLPAGPGPGIDRTDADVCLNFPAFDPIAYIDQPNENLGDLKTSGFDVSLIWRPGATDYGRFVIGLDGTYVTKYEYQRERGGQFIDALGDYTDNAPVFRWQHVLTLNWTAGPWSAVFANRYKSGYMDQGGANEVGNYSVFDTTLTWTSKNLTLSGGVLNLLDKDPPRSVQSTTFQRGYDPRFTDPRGRTWLMRVGYKFI
jgi:iron complex outermembrane receptor protein